MTLKTKGALCSFLKKKALKSRPNKRYGGDGGIRTHVPVKATRFRVELVMTTSIRLHMFSIIA